MNRQAIKAQQLALDRQHGASFLLRQSLLLLKDEAAELPSSDWLHYLEQLILLASRLQNIRPAMAAIKNGMGFFIQGVEALKVSDPPPDAVQAVTSVVDAILKNLDRDYSLTVANGASMIKSGERLISCSFSATVCSAILQTVAEGKSCSVMIVETPHSNLPYGEMMASALRSGGVESQVICIEKLEYHLQNMTLALVGADSIWPDGAAVNGTPSLALAQACHAHQVPFYCLCESHKYATSPPALPLEEGFDIIPARLITAIITEKCCPTRSNDKHPFTYSP